LARRGPKPPASARPATGGRFAPAGPGAGLSWCLNLPVYRASSREGGGNAVRFLFPPGGVFQCNPGSPASLAAAIALATAQGCPKPAGGPKPPASARPAPRRALACVGAGCTGLCGSVAQGWGKRGSRFLFPPKGAIPVPGSG